MTTIPPATNIAGLPRRERPRRQRPVAIAASLRFRPSFEVVEDRTLLSTFLVDHHGRQRPRLAPPGDPRFQRRDRRDEHDRLRHPGQGVQTIAPALPLPAITNPVLIDGISQPGYTGTPLIELSGSRLAAATA